jgi:hypothetical protein
MLEPKFLSWNYIDNGFVKRYGVGSRIFMVGLVLVGVLAVVALLGFSGAVHVPLVPKVLP